MTDQTAHIKLVFPPGTKKNVKRTSRPLSVRMTLNGFEFTLPGVMSIDLHTPLDGVESVTMDLCATVEVVYEEGEVAPTTVGPTGVVEWENR